MKIDSEYMELLIEEMKIKYWNVEEKRKAIYVLSMANEVNKLYQKYMDGKVTFGEFVRLLRTVYDTGCSWR